MSIAGSEVKAWRYQGHLRAMVESRASLLGRVKKSNSAKVGLHGSL